MPTLQAREIDRNQLEAVFADFADWHSNASPIVSVLPDAAAYGDLVLDITGVSHLFGGERAMLDRVIGRLEALGFAVAGAIADSVGTAWALAHFSPGEVIGTDAASALADLPVGALRLDEKQIAGLLQMGLKRVGQLYGRDRKALQARFGVSLLTRLDQALGVIEDGSSRASDCRILWRVALPRSDRADRRCADVGARPRHPAFRRSRARWPWGAELSPIFIPGRPQGDDAVGQCGARHPRCRPYRAAVSNRAERLGGEYDAGFGIDMIRLAASSTSPLDAAQIGAFETRDGAEDLEGSMTG